MKDLSYLIDVDNQSELHLTRLLILITVLTHRKHIKKINGITKLVKLDFLLRYPVALKRALDKIGNTDLSSLNIEKYEWSNVESSMIRFKYGPWDKRYRNFLAILESYGFLRVEKEKETIFIELTTEGEQMGNRLQDHPEFETYSQRSKIIWKYFEKMNGSELKNLMYEIIPEIKTTKFGGVLSF